MTRFVRLWLVKLVSTLNRKSILDGSMLYLIKSHPSVLNVMFTLSMKRELSAVLVITLSRKWTYHQHFPILCRLLHQEENVFARSWGALEINFAISCGRFQI